MATTYLQIGFNKCGTMSIARFFSRNGIPTVHWDNGRLAYRMQQNLKNGDFILSGYEDYEAFTDMEHLTSAEFIEGYKYYEKLLDQVEDPKFILNTRDRERWITSRLHHYDYAELQSTLLGVDRVPDLVDYWRKEWDAHHAAVRECLPADRLLVFNVETDSPLQLCDFAGLRPQAARHYTIENFRLSRIGSALSHYAPAGFKRRFSSDFKVKLRRALRKR